MLIELAEIVSRSAEEPGSWFRACLLFAARFSILLNSQNCTAIGEGICHCSVLVLVKSPVTLYSLSCPLFENGLKGLEQEASGLLL